MRTLLAVAVAFILGACGLGACGLAACSSPYRSALERQPAVGQCAESQNCGDGGY
jgi:hypothetical protein